MSAEDSVNLESVVNAHLESEVDRLERENADLRRQADRPVTVQSDRAIAGELTKITSYLPQLTFLSTNVSSIASAIHRSNANDAYIAKTLERIATALEKMTP